MAGLEAHHYKRKRPLKTNWGVQTLPVERFAAQYGELPEGEGKDATEVLLRHRCTTRGTDSSPPRKTPLKPTLPYVQGEAEISGVQGYPLNSNSEQCQVEPLPDAGESSEDDHAHALAAKAVAVIKMTHSKIAF